MFHYTVQPNSDTPIYKQLVDQINAEIRSGVLKTGTQLPTVREMAELLGLSCGTVKRVYDRLQEMGDIEMTRRRGTFVKYVRENQDSRKIRAMAAIDNMIRQLTELNFSPSEIHIFVGLKMREWGLKWSGIRIALLTECPELGDSMIRQLEQLGNVRATVWQLRQVREYPYNIDEQSDVILASAEDAAKLLPLLPSPSKLIKVAFSPASASLLALSAAAGHTVGVLCRSEGFGELMLRYLPEPFRGRTKLIPVSDEMTAIPGEPEYLIAAEDWESRCTGALAAAIEPWAKRGAVLSFRYGIDEGSIIYLEERISQIRDEQQVKPASFLFDSSL